MKQQLEVDGRTLTLTNLDKVLYPAVQFTKAQVIEYYARVTEWILPHLRDRPVTMKRFPDGIGGQAFYEKDAPRFTPDWVATTQVPRRMGGKDIRYILVNDRPTLVWCANIASLELHPFLHRVAALDVPTSIVFDLDPGEGMTVADCGNLAFRLREVLKRLGLDCLAKLSGSKGLQVYVPLNTPVTYAATLPFARSVAELLARENPHQVVSEMAKKLRAGKIFIDWSQNSDFKTTIGVYSLRAKRERPFVSLPVSWEELAEIVDSRDTDRLCLEPEAALHRLGKVGDLFAPALTLKQTLPQNAEPAAAARSRRFVVQKHAATRLHYDFRLEMHDALKSWAIPKGVPYSLDERRLAVPTEDHPVEYIDFEGTIPKGQYGGGTVMVWDTGTYELLDGNYYKGKLHFVLYGKKLKGEWLLVKGRPSDKSNWFLSKAGKTAAAPSAKREDESALTGRSMDRIAAANDAQWHSNRSDAIGLNLDALPKSTGGFIEPMQALLSAELPGGAGWQYEIKLDGYRALAVSRNGSVELLSRRNNPLNERFPRIAEALKQIEDGMIVDGEVVALDEKGRPSFNLLQNDRGGTHPVVYYAFDVLAWRGKSLLGVPLRQRREVLDVALRDRQEPIRISATLEGEPAELIAAVKEQALEGLVAKRVESLYEAGRRSGAWVKYKIDRGQELVIGGYKPGAGSFESLAVGYYEGAKLQFVGKVKNGFVSALKAGLMARFRPLETVKCPFANLPEPKSARRGEALTEEAMQKYRWLKPKLVAQIAFTEWTDANHLRHSRFVGLRDDKKPRDAVREN